MKQQNRIKYIPPLVLDHVELETESPILAGSVVDSFNAGGVKTNGQEVQDMNIADESSFSHDWR